MHFINPLHLDDPIENKVLYYFLKHNQDKFSFVNKNIEYKISIKGINYVFKLTHDILIRQREWNKDNYPGQYPKDYPKQYRYEIFDNIPMLGDGGSGEILKFAGTLMPTPDKELVLKDNIKRVDKRQQVLSSLTTLFMNVANAEKDFYNLAHADIGAKHPVLVQDGSGNIYTHMILHLLPGISLLKLINDKNIKTVEQMLQLMIDIIRAYQEQLHDKNIIHCDGKPDNIMFDPNTHRLTVIDFGHSVVKGQDSSAMTPKYSDPISSKNVGECRDMYAIGKMLEDLLICTGLINSPDLDESHVEIIQTIIEQSTTLDYMKRITTDESLEILEQIRIERTAKNADELKLLKMSHEIARLVRLEYRKCVKSKDLSALKNILFTGLNQLDLLISKSVGQETLVVKEFIETLNIYGFTNLTTTEDIRYKFSEINDNYAKNMKKILVLEQAINKLPYHVKLKEHVNFLKSEIQRIKTKEDRFNIVNIDIMLMLNDKFEHYLDYFNAEFEKLKNDNRTLIALRKNMAEIHKIDDALSKINRISNLLQSISDRPVVIKTLIADLARIPGFAGVKKLKSLSMIEWMIWAKKEVQQTFNNYDNNLDRIDQFIRSLEMLPNKSILIKILAADIAKVPGFEGIEINGTNDSAKLLQALVENLAALKNNMLQKSDFLAVKIGSR